MTCRGICERLRIDKKRYGIGVKRCTACDVYILYSESFCLCCGRKLRSKRKSKIRADKKPAFLHKIIAA
jgi:rRNA maturation endonuclease Nob1